MNDDGGEVRPNITQWRGMFVNKTQQTVYWNILDDFRRKLEKFVSSFLNKETNLEH